MKSPTLIFGLIGLSGSLAWFVWGGWLTGAKQEHKTAVQAAPVPSVNPIPPAPVSTQAPINPAPPPITPIRIQGGMQLDEHDPDSWIWVTEQGELLTELELASRTGGTVTSRMVRGVRVLSGTGIIWGGVPSDRQTQSHEWPKGVDSPRVDPGPNEDFKGNGVDLLKSPPSLL